MDSIFLSLGCIGVSLSFCFGCMDGYCALIWGLFLVSGFQFVYYDKKFLFFFIFGDFIILLFYSYRIRTTKI